MIKGNLWSKKSSIEDRYGKNEGSVPVKSLQELVQIQPSGLYQQIIKIAPTNFRQPKTSLFNVPIIGEVWVEINENWMRHLKSTSTENRLDWRESHLYSKKIAIIQAVRRLISNAQKDGHIGKAAATDFAYNTDIFAQAKELNFVQSRCWVDFSEACGDYNAPFEPVKKIEPALGKI